MAARLPAKIGASALTFLLALPVGAAVVFSVNAALFAIVEMNSDGLLVTIAAFILTAALAATIIGVARHVGAPNLLPLLGALLGAIGWSALLAFVWALCRCWLTVTDGLEFYSPPD